MSEKPYAAILETSFRARYENGQDIWTGEDVMSVAARLLLETLPAGGGARVLDIGAGAGRDAELFLAAGHEVVAVDLYAHPVWRGAAARWGGRLRFEQGHFLEWAKDRGERFDAVLDAGCFHHQLPADYQRYLMAARALLLPGGRAAVCVFTPNDPEAPSFTKIIDEGRLGRYFSEADLQAELGLAGFRWERSRRLRREPCGLHYLAALIRREEP